MRWILERWTLFLIKYWVLILVCAIATTALSILPLTKLKLNTDITSLLPKDYESVKSIKKALDKYGGFGNFFLVIESENPSDSKRYINLIAKEIETHPKIAYVDFKTEKEYFEHNKLLYLSVEDLETLRHRIETKIISEKKRALNWILGKETNPSYKIETKDLIEKYRGAGTRLGRHEYFQTDDGKIFVALVKPKASNTNLKEARAIRDDLQKIIDKSQPETRKVKVGLGGTFVNRINEFEGISRDIFSTGLFAILGVILLMAIYFRQWAAVIFISIPLLMGMCWTFAITQLFIGELNLITGFLVAILFGLGIDFGIHLFSRYQEARGNGATRNSALIETLKQTGAACFTSASTTAAAFYVLMICDFKGFSEFGFISGTGLLISLVAIFLIFPSMIIIGEHLHLIKPRFPAGHPKPAKARASFRFGPLIFIVSAVVVLLALQNFSHIEFEYNFSQLRAIDPKTEEIKEKYYQVFSESQTPAIVITQNREELDAIQKILKTQKENDSTPTFGAFRTIYSFIPSQQEEKLKVIGSIKHLLSDPLLNVLEKPDRERIANFRQNLPSGPIKPENLPEGIRRQFRGIVNDGSQFGFIFPQVELKDGKQAIAFAQDVRTIKTPSGPFYPSSEAIIFADLLEIMLHDGKFGLIAILFLMVILIWIDLKRLDRTLIVLTPLIGGMIWMVGLMPILGLKFNFFNIVILAAILGIGEDNGVHIYHRYLELGRGSILTALRTSGGACLMSTLTTLIGFSGCITASHPGLKSIGILAVLGLTTTTVATFTLMPALIETLEWLQEKFKTATLF
ncbi:MAG TPA: MMPL family transporter [Bdellovibrionota bacterium]|nr:MMPL family transporter [Bdellovibrionota bacterium]